MRFQPVINKTPYPKHPLSIIKALTCSPPSPPPPPPKKKKVVRVYYILKHCGLLLDIIMQNIVYDYWTWSSKIFWIIIEQNQVYVYASLLNVIKQNIVNDYWTSARKTLCIITEPFQIKHCPLYLYTIE